MPMCPHIYTYVGKDSPLVNQVSATRSQGSKKKTTIVPDRADETQIIAKDIP